MSLQGLNLVYAEPAYSAEDLLLDSLHQPELNTQLDFWSNLVFESEEPSPLQHIDPRTNDDPNERERQQSLPPAYWAATAIREGHQNVFTGTEVERLPPNVQVPAAVPTQQQPPPHFDVDAFIAGFNIGKQPSSLPSVKTPEQSRPTKRARTTDTVAPSTTGTVDEFTEDKRKRNTAASARFRQKKKEREAALEGRTKTLEVRVQELEQECDGLKRENGWLKGIVAGVAGGSSVTLDSLKRKHSEL